MDFLPISRMLCREHLTADTDWSDTQALGGKLWFANWASWDVTGWLQELIGGFRCRTLKINQMRSKWDCPNRLLVWTACVASLWCVCFCLDDSSSVQAHSERNGVQRNCGDHKEWPQVQTLEGLGQTWLVQQGQRPRRWTVQLYLSAQYMCYFFHIVNLASNQTFLFAGIYGFCRNPDNSPGGPWCYYLDAQERTQWEYCAIPFCPPPEGMCHLNCFTLISSRSKIPFPSKWKNILLWVASEFYSANLACKSDLLTNCCAREGGRGLLVPWMWATKIHCWLAHNFDNFFCWSWQTFDS